MSLLSRLRGSKEYEVWRDARPSRRPNRAKPGAMEREYLKREPDVVGLSFECKKLTAEAVSFSCWH